MWNDGMKEDMETYMSYDELVTFLVFNPPHTYEEKNLNRYMYGSSRWTNSLSIPKILREKYNSKDFLGHPVRNSPVRSNQRQI